METPHEHDSRRHSHQAVHRAKANSSLQKLAVVKALAETCYALNNCAELTATPFVARVLGFDDQAEIEPQRVHEVEAALLQSVRTRPGSK